MSELKSAKGTGGNIRTNPNPGSTSKNRILYEAVVVNFFSNPVEDLEKNPPNDKDKTYKSSMKIGSNKVTNPELISKMPRGSIIARVTSDSSAWSDNGICEIFYPLFPHITMPIKSGEKVWVIYETGSRSTSQKGFWISRIASNINVDDPNYTHNDREGLYKNVPSSPGAIEAREGASVFDKDTVFSFIAGSTGNASENTFSSPDEYNLIVGSSLSYKEQFTGEPVPRFSPRVGDLVLEGSNNTLLCLGQDRPSLIGPEDESGEVGIGTIDIVVGRGQTPNTSIVSTVPISKRSEDLVDYEEGNKFPEFESVSSNIGEGNPDFETDLSRIYVSMKTNGDSNFGLSFGAADNVESAPYVIAKSTEIRLVSREGGSIRMVKEGSSQAEICITDDGKIYIEGTNSRPTKLAIRGEDLVDAVDEFCGQMETKPGCGVEV